MSWNKGNNTKMRLYILIWGEVKAKIYGHFT